MAELELIGRATSLLPFGILGDLVHPFLVKPPLEKIFHVSRKSVVGMFSV